MCFLGREKELRELETLYEAEGFQMLIMYGRLRIGKSLLPEKFVQGKQRIFFTAVENNVRQNLHSFEESIFQVFPMGEVHPHFSSFEEALSFIGENTADQRLVVIIDEYPYLAMEDRSASSVLQKCIDRDWIHRNIFLILCGSSISFMEDEVLSAKSPLFGRRTAQLDLQPFGYEEAALFVPDYTPQEKLIAVRIVNREVPILNKNKRYVRYVLSDGVFAF